MGLLDGPLRSVAKTLVGVLGADAALRQVTSTYNAVNGTETTATLSASIRISPPEPYSAYRVDGTMVQAGDARCIVAAKDLEDAGFVLPTGSHKNLYLDIGTETWTVVRTMQIRSGDQAAAVELQLRR